MSAAGRGGWGSEQVTPLMYCRHESKELYNEKDVFHGSESACYVGGR